MTIGLLLSTAGRPLFSQTAGSGLKLSDQAGAISGVVSEGAAGRPLAGVVVTLTDGAAKISLRTVSDSKGRFVFRGLPPSSGYAINAIKPGYVGSGLVRSFALADVTRIPLDEGQWIPDVRVAMWRLGAISGRVVDENGEPIVDVPIRAIARILIAGTTQLTTGPAARTDDRGIYRITGLRAGSYIVTVPSVQSVVPGSTPIATAADLPSSILTLGGRQIPKIAGLDIGGSWLVIANYATPPPPSPDHPQAYPVLFHANARSVRDATPVRIVDGEEKRNVDFALQPVPTARISGRVIGPSAVIARLVLRLLPDGSEMLGAGFEQATGLVSSDGSFTLVGIPAGRYTLDASPTLRELSGGGAVAGPVPVPLPSTPGVISETGPVVTTISSAPEGTLFVSGSTTGHEDYSARLDVTVGSTDITGISVPLKVGATISGRIVREDGAPVSGRMSIVVEPANGDPTLGRLLDRDVGPAGAFSIRGLQRGEYFLRAGLVKSIIAADGDHTDRPFDASSGQDITDVVVTLTDRPATLSGVVRDRPGAPIREGAVILFPTYQSLWTRFGFDPPRIKAVTFFGSRGYQIQRLVQGDYYVIAVELTLRDAWHDPRFFVAAAPLATRVALRWGQTAVQNLTIQQVAVK